MTDIDWSKAPEDATHYGSKFDDQRMIVCWYRDRGIDGMDYWYSTAGELDGRGWKPLRNPPGHWPLIPRPANTVVWDGQGLPPVGMTCEYKRAGMNWKPVTVFAHKPNTNGSISVLFDYVGVSEWGACADPSSFRLPLTPEQIAAEERKKTIQEMLDVDQCGTLSRTKFCNLLYDAGYRKVENGIK
ncbi:hypothetical protein [Pseudomonas citronellolis]|uniref:hypothetical protein n=1 Tax=Pseudomonas citronellolis TaxID=53408 RepID=UPI0021C0F227|nr:hypothetical protein [Pseudomonas citronellolis]UXJ54868.1 hypothetical protein N5P21_11930 [Pseudomonas citronellolis]